MPELVKVEPTVQVHGVEPSLDVDGVKDPHFPVPLFWLCYVQSQVGIVTEEHPCCTSHVGLGTRLLLHKMLTG